MIKTKPTEQHFNFSFPAVRNGTQKNQTKCLSKVIDKMNEIDKTEEYKPDFCKTWGWHYFPTWFRLVGKTKTFDGYFYKEKKGQNYLKVNLEQAFKEENLSRQMIYKSFFIE